MAEPQDISLKIFVDKERNKIVLAEADRDFVDVLFSFLNIPLGNIIRLVRDRDSSQPPVLGCFDGLYKGLENLGDEHFRTTFCKRMLLSPRTVDEDQWKKLKLNLNATEATKYYICSDIGCSRRDGALFSVYPGLKCFCGKIMNREIHLKEGDPITRKAETEESRGVFVLTDALQVQQSSVGVIMELLDVLGIEDGNKIEEEVVNFGLEKIIELLKHSVISSSALTSTFLGKQDYRCFSEVQNTGSMIMEESEVESEGSMDLNVFRRKADGKILYAESGNDFVDFLFTFLALPLKSAFDLLGSDMPLGPISNLNQSFNNLIAEKILIREGSCVPELPPHYSCENQHILSIVSRPRPSLFLYVPSYGDRYYLTKALVQTRDGYGRSVSCVSVTSRDPKSEAASTSSSGFLKRKSKFIIRNDLTVSPVLISKVISALKDHNVSAGDAEEITVKIGKTQAIGILRASLTTSSALSNGLSIKEQVTTASGDSAGASPEGSLAATASETAEDEKKKDVDDVDGAVPAGGSAAMAGEVIPSEDEKRENVDDGNGAFATEEAVQKGGSAATAAASAEKKEDGDEEVADVDIEYCLV